MNVLSSPKLSFILDDSSKKRFRICLVLLFCIRLLYAFAAWHSPFASDANDYVNMAHLLVDRVHFVPYWPPGLPAYLAFWIDGGLSDQALRLPMLLFWILCCYGIYRLALDMRVPHYAWLLLLLFGLTPSAIYVSAEPLTQLPVAALLLISISSAIRVIRLRSRTDAVLLGVSTGWLTLIRPSAALVAALLLGAVLFRKERRFLGAVGLSIFCVVLASWLLYSHHLSGAWVINTANSKNFFYGNNAATPLYRTWYFGSHDKEAFNELPGLAQANATGPIAAAKWYGDAARSYVLAHPGLFLLRTFNRFRCFWAFDTFAALQLRRVGPFMFWTTFGLEASAYIVVSALAILFLSQASRDFWNLESSLLLLTVLLYAVPYWLSMSHPTYHFPLTPLIWMLGLAGWKGSRIRLPVKLRTWLCLLAFFYIQIEWVFVMKKTL